MAVYNNLWKKVRTKLSKKSIVVFSGAPGMVSLTDMKIRQEPLLLSSSLLLRKYMREKKEWERKRLEYQPVCIYVK